MLACERTWQATVWTEACLKPKAALPGLVEAHESMSASRRLRSTASMVVPAGSSRPPALSMGGSCASVKVPEHATTAATLRSIWSATGSRSMREVMRVSTLEGKSTSAMRMPSASSMVSLEMSSTPCSTKDVTKPLAKKGLPPERVVIAEESVYSTCPVTPSWLRMSSSMSGRVSSVRDSRSLRCASILVKLGSVSAIGLVVSTSSSGCTRPRTALSSAQLLESIQCVSSNISVECAPGEG